MAALAKTLAELDAIPTLLETLKERLDVAATKARVALETMAVALEDEEAGEFKEPKELTELKELAIDSNDLQRLRMNEMLLDSLLACDALYQILISQIGNIEIVDKLLQFVDPSVKNNDAIRAASRVGYLAVVKRLLADPRVDPSALDNDAIIWASQNGHLAVVERLLADPRVDPSANNNYAIISASINGHVAVVERLLQDQRVDPSAADNRSIQWASNNGHVAVVERLLLDPRVDPSANNNGAIRWASRDGRVAVVELLKARGCVLPA